jgi:signal transduction histidine kinase/CheY-like chemotaxis protein/HPt (histidine-containing phosphotransfer) domain-containing protein
MARFRKTSIRTRLLLMIALAITAAQLVALVFAGWNEVVRYGDAKRDVLVAQANVLAAAAAQGMSREDDRAVQAALAAIGRIDGVVHVAIADAQGRVMARSGRTEMLAGGLVIDDPDAPLAVLDLLLAQTITIVTPVTRAGENVGSLRLIADVSDLPGHLRDAVGITLIGALLALAIALAIVLPLQRAITGPLGLLSAAMAGVVGRGRDTITAHPLTPSAPAGREIDLLIAGFNRMITDIAQRDADLARHRDELEEQVRARTADFKEAAARADAANHAKSAFLATMSHEIRTPMNGVLVMAELLADAPLPDAERRKAQLIARSGRNLLAIINDILDFSKIEAGKLEIVTEPHDPAETIGAVQALYTDAAAEKGIELAVEGTLAAGCGVRADPVRLGQVLSNLVSNAIKFTSEGTVRISVAPAPDDAGMVRFVVSDTGIGIPADKQEAIFAAFTQADQTTQRHYGGTGLGLSIALRLVEAMGGTLRLESAPGEGSAFSFDLPACAVEITDAPEKREKALADFTGARVLVADDNETNLVVASAALGRFGIEPVCVRDGEAALAALAAADYDLVLMDGWMPKLDGYAAARAIRADEARTGRAKIAIVALTAHVVGAKSQAWAEAGMDGALSKPFTLHQLQEVLARHLPARLTRGMAAAPEGVAAPADHDRQIHHEQPHDRPIDPAILTDLIAAAGGSPAIAQKVAGLFDVESRRRLDDLREAVASDNAERLAAAAHALRSISLNVGATELAQSLAECEAGARDAGALITTDAAEALAGEVAGVNRALGDFLRKHG